MQVPRDALMQEKQQEILQESPGQEAFPLFYSDVPYRTVSLGLQVLTPAYSRTLMQQLASRL